MIILERDVINDLTIDEISVRLSKILRRNTIIGILSRNLLTIDELINMFKSGKKLMLISYVGTPLSVTVIVRDRRLLELISKYVCRTKDGEWLIRCLAKSMRVLALILIKSMFKLSDKEVYNKLRVLVSDEPSILKSIISTRKGLYINLYMFKITINKDMEAPIEVLIT